MRQTLESIVRVVCLIALGAVVTSAQPSGQLTGVVRDTTGSVLPGVTVTITGAALSAPRTVVTNEHGEYVVDALRAGRYLVTAAFSLDNDIKYKMIEMTSTSERLTKLRSILLQAVDKMEANAEIVKAAQTNGHSKKKLDL